LLTLERMGKKSAENILNEMRIEKLPLERVIYGLGIRFVGGAHCAISGRGFRIDGRGDESSEEELQESMKLDRASRRRSVSFSTSPRMSIW